MFNKKQFKFRWVVVNRHEIRLAQTAIHYGHSRHQLKAQVMAKPNYLGFEFIPVLDRAYR